jgi:sigma-B regulation protein RsbU (phosphoserine phosphatase)
MSWNDATAIVVLDTDLSAARRIGSWLRDAGLRGVLTARTCDEALFLLGRKNPLLLIIDEHISVADETRLLWHIALCGHAPAPAIVRVLADNSPNLLAVGRRMAAGSIRKPLDRQDVVVQVGLALRRPDLAGELERNLDQSVVQLETARRMQLGLLPRADELEALEAECGVGLAGFYRSGQAVGGDFWGAWPTGRGRLALSVVDFAGHGLGAALNTFRLHAILHEPTLPRGLPVRMTSMLNRRLHGLLQRGEYATMIYALIDPAGRRIKWCSAGGPSPLFVGANGVGQNLEGRGLPLGVREGSAYRSCNITLPGPGILCLFSDGLYECGAGTDDITREEIKFVLTKPASLAGRGQTREAARLALVELEALRERHPCLDHSDDIMTVCVAFGPGPERFQANLNGQRALSHC